MFVSKSRRNRNPGENRNLLVPVRVHLEMTQRSARRQRRCLVDEADACFLLPSDRRPWLEGEIVLISGVRLCTRQVSQEQAASSLPEASQTTWTKSCHRRFSLVRTFYGRIMTLGTLFLSSSDQPTHLVGLLQPPSTYIYLG